MADVLILTGPPGAGKSTVAQALAERYDRVAHIPVDTLHEFITPTGHVRPWGDPAAYSRQRSLLVRNACCLTANFLEQRFAVIIDDVVTEQAHLQLYLDNLQGLGFPVHFVRLLPELDVCLQRNQERKEGRVSPDRVRKVHSEIRAAGEFAGKTIDSSELTPYQTADRLQELTTSGASLVLAPAQRS